MSEETIICRFVFTPQELRRAMVCYWRYSPMKWWFIVVFLFLSALALDPFHLFSDSSGQKTTVTPVFATMVPVILLMVFVVGLTLFQTTWTFRKGAYCNQDMAYAFREAGIHLETPRVQSDMKWEVFSRVTENKNGFVLFNMGKRSFNWFPKSGFVSPESVDQCRELFRKNVKDSRWLFASCGG